MFVCFGQADPIKVQILGLSTARMKIYQIPYVIFEFSFKLCNNLQCHDTWFLWNFLTATVYALEKKSPSMYNFQTFGCSNESSPNSSCHFWNHKVRVYSKIIRIWWILIRALKSLKSLHFDWSFLCKVYNVWPKKVQRSFISRHWRVMQNLKKNRLVVWKMTWGIGKFS